MRRGAGRRFAAAWGAVHPSARVPRLVCLVLRPSRPDFGVRLGGTADQVCGDLRVPALAGPSIPIILSSDCRPPAAGAVLQSMGLYYKVCSVASVCLSAAHRACWIRAHAGCTLHVRRASSQGCAGGGGGVGAGEVE